MVNSPCLESTSEAGHPEAGHPPDGIAAPKNKGDADLRLAIIDSEQTAAVVSCSAASPVGSRSQTVPSPISTDRGPQGPDKYLRRGPNRVNWARGRLVAQADLRDSYPRPLRSRTAGRVVDRGCFRTSRATGGRSGAVLVGLVAVLRCCTAKDRRRAGTRPVWAVRTRRGTWSGAG
jgi:hypothetical protein